MNSILSIKGLGKKFGGVCAVDEFSLELEQGTTHGLIGPNGAGKTTIFNLMTGIYHPTAGTMALRGTNLVGLGSYRIAQLGIGRTFQNIRLFTQLSVIDNVVMASGVDATYGMVDAIFKTRRYQRDEAKIRKRARELLDLLGLGGVSDERAGALPYGSQRKLEIARALAARPVLLLLDEPAAGMNEEESMELVGFIRDVRKRFDLTVLLIEHHMSVVMEICDRITVLDFGRTICNGIPKEVQANRSVIDAYLGETTDREN